MRSRAEKFGVVETNRDEVSLSWSSQSDHRKPVPGEAEAHSRPSRSQPLQSQPFLEGAAQHRLIIRRLPRRGHRTVRAESQSRGAGRCQRCSRTAGEAISLVSKTNDSRPTGGATNEQPPAAVQKELAIIIIQHQIGSLPPIYNAEVRWVHVTVTDHNIKAFDNNCAVSAAILHTLFGRTGVLGSGTEIGKETSLKLAAACKANRLTYSRRTDYDDNSGRYQNNKRSRAH